MKNETESTRFGDHDFTAPELLAILDGFADGITAEDTSGRLIYANPAAALIAGFPSVAAMVGTPIPQIVSALQLKDEHGTPLPVEARPGRSALSGAVEGERLLRFRLPATAEERWATIKTCPVLDAAGGVRFIINIWHDVTDTIRHQEALERASQRADFLAEAGRLLAASLNVETTLRTIAQLAVPRIADICQISLAEDYGELRQLEVAHADPERLHLALELQQKYPPQRRIHRSLYRVLQTGESELYRDVTDEMLADWAYDAEHLRLMHALELRSAMLVALKIRGEVLGVISFLGTQSGRRFDERDLVFAESLAARSALALANARLYNAAQEGNRVKSDFLAVMSHELRTPLTAIFGYTELLSTEIGGPMTPQQKAQLERIRHSASHLLSIIEDILNYARSEAGRDEVRSETVRLSGVVTEALDLVRVAAERKRLSLKSHITSDCVLQTDRVKLRQFLVNLLGNAVKFTDRGSVRINASCPDGHEIVIEVADTGVGIPPADLARIFEPFRQLESPITRTVGGTGLGLAVTKRFAELLGGSIAVHSEVRKGTTFTVRIPVVRRS
jgi:signal transduction histidine kinase